MNQIVQHVSVSETTRVSENSDKRSKYHFFAWTQLSDLKMCQVNDGK